MLRLRKVNKVCCILSSCRSAFALPLWLNLLSLCAARLHHPGRQCAPSAAQLSCRCWLAF